MTHDITQMAAMLAQSETFAPDWYCKQYPDVLQVGLSPALHYLKYGAQMGRDPSPWFDTVFYLETNTDVAQSGQNPLVHYILNGCREGRAASPQDQTRHQDAAQIDHLRAAVLQQGFTDVALADLETIATTGARPFLRTLAARERALWHLRRDQPNPKTGAKDSLPYIQIARQGGLDAPSLVRLTTLEMMARSLLGDHASALAAYLYETTQGRVNHDTKLAMVNFETSAEARVQKINQVMQDFNLPEISLHEDSTKQAYDRLYCTVKPYVSPHKTPAPVVSVLVAAYNAEHTLPTTLRALQEQSWHNLEIIVVDDCSRDNTFEVAQQIAAKDPRIQVFQTVKNGGAYIARNQALDKATGEFVTLLDADDWAHPLRIETQVTFMQTHPGVMGTTSQQARAGNDLGFRRWTGRGDLIITNTASFMFRRGPMRAKLGYWDTVKVSADNELIRRFRHCFGENSVVDMPTGPLTLQRDTNQSAVRSGPLGVTGYLFGARQDYKEAQLFHHAHAKTLRYQNDPKNRPFPTPEILHSAPVSQRNFNIILGGDFRLASLEVKQTDLMFRAARKGNLQLGLFQIFPYDPKATSTALHPDVRAEIDGVNTHTLTYGETAQCDHLLLPTLAALRYPQRYTPHIIPKNVHIICPKTATSADLLQASIAIERFFSANTIWVPLDAEARQTLSSCLPTGISLSGGDWPGPQNWLNSL